MTAVLKKIGKVYNTQHHAQPLILCDANVPYGGWDEHESDILEEWKSISLLGLSACIVQGGFHGVVYVFTRGTDFILVNESSPRQTDMSQEAEQSASIDQALKIAQRNLDDRPILGMVDVPSQKLAIGIAYNAMNRPNDVVPNAAELLIVSVTALHFEVRGDEYEDGWHIELRAVI